MIDVVYVVFIKTDNVLPYIHRIFRSEERANEEVKVILSQVRSELFTVWVDKQEVY